MYNKFSFKKYREKNFGKKSFLVVILKVTSEKTRILIQIQIQKVRILIWTKGIRNTASAFSLRVNAYIFFWLLFVRNSYNHNRKRIRHDTV